MTDYDQGCVPTPAVKEIAFIHKLLRPKHRDTGLLAARWRMLGAHHQLLCPSMDKRPEAAEQHPGEEQGDNRRADQQNRNPDPHEHLDDVFGLEHRPQLPPHMLPAAWMVNINHNRCPLMECPHL